MAGIRISGMASGLPPDIVEQIMAAERIPEKNLEAKKTKQEDLLKLVGELEGKVTDITKNLGELVGTRGFTDAKLTSGDPTIIDGVVDPQTAQIGDYSVEVTQLAQKPGVMTNGFPDEDKTQIGVGYMKFDTAEGRKEVYISPKNNTLKGIAAQITGSGLGLRAQVVNDRKDPQNPFRILITGIAPGKDKQVNFPTVYMLDGDADFNFQKAMPSSNAKVKVDGFEIELPDNSAKDVIPGVTLDLKQAAVGRPIRISVRENQEVISGKVKSFVDSYNAALAFVQNQHKLQKGPNGKESLGPLGGDGMLRSLESRLRATIQDAQFGLGSKITRIGELGIEFNRQGTLNFAQDKFNKVLASDPQSVALFLRGDGFQTGFIPSVKRAVATMTDGSYGALAQRKKGLSDKVEALNKQIDNKERQLEKKEDFLRKKFSDLESKMSQMQGQGAAVAGMNGGGGR